MDAAQIWEISQHAGIIIAGVLYGAARRTQGDVRGLTRKAGQIGPALDKLSDKIEQIVKRVDLLQGNVEGLNSRIDRIEDRVDNLSFNRRKDDRDEA